jgi:hypothetical protein
LGTPSDGNPKPLLVKLRSYSDRMAVFKNAHRLKLYGRNIQLRDDIPKEKRIARAKRNLILAEQRSNANKVKFKESRTLVFEEEKERKNQTPKNNHQPLEEGRVTQEVSQEPNESRVLEPKNSSVYLFVNNLGKKSEEIGTPADLTDLELQNEEEWLSVQHPDPIKLNLTQRLHLPPTGETHQPGNNGLKPPVPPRRNIMISSTGTMTGRSIGLIQAVGKEMEANHPPPTPLSGSKLNNSPSNSSPLSTLSRNNEFRDTSRTGRKNWIQSLFHTKSRCKF